MDSSSYCGFSYGWRYVRCTKTSRRSARARLVLAVAANERCTRRRPRRRKHRSPVLVIIDGPLAGSSVPLTEAEIGLGRAASNTVVLDDEFVSSHHARVYRDPSSGQWAIEDLNSTNGTVVNQQRISQPTILPARVPVRIGATTFELR